MRNQLPKIWISLLLAITVGLLAWQRLGMDRVMTLDGETRFPAVPFDDKEDSGASTAQLTRHGHDMLLTCDMVQQYKWPYCGITMEFDKGIDFSRFETMVLDVEATGPGAPNLRVDLKNYDPAFSKEDDQRTFKINEVQFIPGLEARPFEVPMANFQVASWWIQEYKISPKHASPDLRRIRLFHLLTGDNLPAGRYRYLIHSIRFHGKWVSRSELLSFVVALWAGSAILYLVLSFFSAQATIRRLGVKRKELEQINAALELERRELKDLASHDPLTGAFNRIGLRNHILEHLKARQRKPAFSIIFMDLDHFKEINDKQGHERGDEVLREFAGLISGSIRGNDFFCRWGGEEFILLCHDMTLEKTRDLAEKLRGRVRGHSWPGNISVTCSFGVARMRVREDIPAFIKRADAALYRAKAEGRDRVVVEEPAAA